MRFQYSLITMPTVALFATALPNSYGNSDLTSRAGADDWKDLVVSQHNSYRSQYGAADLTWSDELYPATLQYAEQCVFQHSASGGQYGENLAAGSGEYGFGNALGNWMDEVSMYDYNNPGFSGETGHFTQVVWKSSNHVACAMANCAPNTIFGQASNYIVCRYTPPGNVIGQFEENIGRPQ